MTRPAAPSPYAAPRVSSLPPPTVRTAMYTPTQVALGTLLGGIVGFIFFLRANFLALGNPDAARNTVLGGVVMLVALVGLALAMPRGFPSIGVTIALVVFARWIAERHQLTKDAIAASSDHDFHSSWRVFAIGLACLVASFVVAFGAITALTLLGTR